MRNSPRLKSSLRRRSPNRLNNGITEQENRKRGVPIDGTPLHLHGSTERFLQNQHAAPTIEAER